MQLFFVLRWFRPKEGVHPRWLDNNVMHTKPDLRVFLKWMIADSGSVITAVMPASLL